MFEIEVDVDFQNVFLQYIFYFSKFIFNINKLKL